MNNTIFEDFILTYKLKNSLSRCIGKDTVQVFRDDYGNLYCFHYGALICAVGETDRVIYNKPYYDYSNSTGRVRNTFIRLFSRANVYTLHYLHQNELAFENGTRMKSLDMIFAIHSNRYDYNIDTKSYNTILSKEIF